MEDTESANGRASSQMAARWCIGLGSGCRKQAACNRLVRRFIASTQPGIGYDKWVTNED